jgi:hypothetical protein
MKFYYSPDKDSYFEVDSRTHRTLELCIDLISYRLDSGNYATMQDLFEEDEVAKKAEDIIKTILTPEQFELYKTAPIY